MYIYIHIDKCMQMWFIMQTAVKIHGGLLCRKKKLMKCAPSLDPTFWCAMLVLLKPKERKKPHDIKQQHFFCFWKLWTVEFPMGMVYSTLDLPGTLNNHFFLSMVVSVG